MKKTFLFLLLCIVFLGSCNLLIPEEEGQERRIYEEWSTYYKEVGSCDESFPFFSNCNASVNPMIIDDKKCYIGLVEDKILVADISDPQDIKVVKTIDFGSHQSGAYGTDGSTMNNFVVHHNSVFYHGGNWKLFLNTSDDKFCGKVESVSSFYAFIIDGYELITYHTIRKKAIFKKYSILDLNDIHEVGRYEVDCIENEFGEYFWFNFYNLDGEFFLVKSANKKAQIMQLDMKNFGNDKFIVKDISLDLVQNLGITSCKNKLFIHENWNSMHVLTANSKTDVTFTKDVKIVNEKSVGTYFERVPVMAAYAHLYDISDDSKIEEISGNVFEKAVAFDSYYMYELELDPDKPRLKLSICDRICEFPYYKMKAHKWNP